MWYEYKFNLIKFAVSVFSIYTNSDIIRLQSKTRHILFLAMTSVNINNYCPPTCITILVLKYVYILWFCIVFSHRSVAVERKSINFTDIWHAMFLGEGWTTYLHKPVIGWQWSKYLNILLYYTFLDDYWNE